MWNSATKTNKDLPIASQSKWLLSIWRSFKVWHEETQQQMYIDQKTLKYQSLTWRNSATKTLSTAAVLLIASQSKWLLSSAIVCHTFNDPPNWSTMGLQIGLEIVFVRKCRFYGFFVLHKMCNIWAKSDVFEESVQFWPKNVYHVNIIP